MQTILITTYNNRLSFSSNEISSNLKKLPFSHINKKPIFFQKWIEWKFIKKYTFIYTIRNYWSLLMCMCKIIYMTFERVAFSLTCEDNSTYLNVSGLERRVSTIKCASVKYTLRRCAGENHLFGHTPALHFDVSNVFWTRALLRIWQCSFLHCLLATWLTLGISHSLLFLHNSIKSIESIQKSLRPFDVILSLHRILFIKKGA